MSVSFTVPNKSVLTGTQLPFTNTSSNLGFEVLPPSELGWALPVKVWWTPSGVTYTYSLSSMLPSGLVSGLIAYCDAASGSDAADGLTWATAKKTFYSASRVTGRKRIFFKPGIYDNDGNTLGTDDCALIGCNSSGTESSTENSGVIIRTQDIATNWTWVSSGGCYFIKLAHTLGAEVWDKSVTDTLGFATKLASAISIASVKATSGSYYIEGNYLYIKRLAGTAPDDNLIISGIGVNSFMLGQQSLYIKGMKFEGGKTPWGISSTNYLTNLYCNNIGIYYAYNNALSMDNFGLVLLENCNAKYCGIGAGQDGFSYSNVTAASGCCKVIELNCNSSWNGPASGTASNGSTIHSSGVTVIRVAGTYTYNAGPNLADVGGPGTDNKGWIIGCTMGNSRTLTAGSNSAIHLISDEVSSQFKFWVQYCTDTTDPVGIAGNSTLYTTANNITGTIASSTAVASGTLCTWNFGDSTSSNGTNPSHTYTSPGVYTVSLIANTLTGSGEALSTVYISPLLNFTDRMKWRATYPAGYFDSTDPSYVRVVYGELDDKI